MALLSKGITLSYKKYGNSDFYEHTMVASNAYLVDENGAPLYVGDRFTATFTGVTKDATPYSSIWDFYNGCLAAANGGTIKMYAIYEGKKYIVFGDCVHQQIEYCFEAIDNSGEIIHIALGNTESDNPSVYIDAVTHAGTYKELTNLQEIAELGNNAREKVDVTTLADDAKKSIDGLADTAQDLPFKFLYDKEQFNELNALEGSHEWRVTLPDGETATFTASPSVKIAGVGVSNPLTYTLTLSVNSKIDFE